LGRLDELPARVRRGSLPVDKALELIRDWPRLLGRALEPMQKVSALPTRHHHAHLHLGHLADAFIQSDLPRVHLLKERQQYITVVHKDKNRAGFKHS